MVNTFARKNRSAALWPLFVASLAGGCLGGGGTPQVASVGKDAVKTAQSDARATAQEVYASVRRGAVDASQTLLADRVVAVGPHSSHVYASRTDTVLALTSGFDAGDRHKLKSRGLAVGAAPTAKSAWVVDRVDLDRRSYTVVAVLASIDEIWYVQAVHVGATEGNNSKASPGQFPAEVDARATELVEMVQLAGQQPKTFLDQLSDHPMTTVLGPGRNDHLRGRRRIRRRWKKLFATDAMMTFSDVAAGVTPDGGLGWVIANASVGEGDKVRSQRMMFVYTHTDEQWRLVAMQTSPI